jgi:hypothetical protein
MKNREGLHKLFGIFLILAGIILYPTPIPGTTSLCILGFVWLIGEKRTINFLRKILGGKIFKSLKIKKLISKINI